MNAKLLLLAAALLASNAWAAPIFFSGNLRNDATVLSCGAGCTLGVANTDGEYAQFAAAVYTFQVFSPTAVQIVTYSYGGGTSAGGHVVAAGGLEPYLSLFNSAGTFLVSSSAGTCPTGARTVGGNCFDAQLDSSPVLQPGTYQIALSAYQNLSFAENLGMGKLADGFTGLGNLAAGESLNFAFDVILPTNTPEPATGLLAGAALAVFLIAAARKARACQESDPKG